MPYITQPTTVFTDHSCQHTDSLMQMISLLGHPNSNILHLIQRWSNQPHKGTPKDHHGKLSTHRPSKTRFFATQNALFHGKAPRKANDIRLLLSDNKIQTRRLHQMQYPKQKGMWYVTVCLFKLIMSSPLKKNANRWMGWYIAGFLEETLAPNLNSFIQDVLARNHDAHVHHLPG